MADKTPITPPAASCEACRGYGPHARVDGHRWDSAGLDAPCPDCGTTARQAMIRRVSIPVLTERDLAIDTVLALPALVHFGREHCAEEPLDSLARTVVDTAHAAGLGFTSIALVPWDAIELTSREWAQLEARRDREARIATSLEQLRAVLSRLDDDEIEGQLGILSERCALLDPAGRP